MKRDFGYWKFHTCEILLLIGLALIILPMILSSITRDVFDWLEWKHNRIVAIARDEGYIKPKKPII